MPDRQKPLGLLAGWDQSEVGAMPCALDPMTKADASMLERVGVSPERIVHELIEHA